MALGMTLSGAQGTTSTQMMETLHWDHENSQSFHQQLSKCMKNLQIDSGENGAVKIANKLFLENKYELLQSYITAMSSMYDGSIEKVGIVMGLV